MSVHLNVTSIWFVNAHDDICYSQLSSPKLTVFRDSKGTSKWFLKISDVDYGCGVCSFQSPVSFAEVQQLLETCHLEAIQSLSQLRKAKGTAGMSKWFETRVLIGMASWLCILSNELMSFLNSFN